MEVSVFHFEQGEKRKTASEVTLFFREYLNIQNGVGM